MMRSLYSGVAGLKTHQTRMDVIGNNIANVNTTAFKSSNVTFSDIMYQTSQQASGASETTGRGGVNAKQTGLGATNAATKISIESSGAAQTTGNAFDLMLNDTNSVNFFVVSNGVSNVFTRDGSFYVDGSGNLCMASTGYNLMGWQTQVLEDGSIGIKKDTVSALRVMQESNLTSPPEATTLGYCAGIVDKNSDDITTEDGQVMNLTFYDALGYSYTAKFSVKTSDKINTNLDGTAKDDGLSPMDRGEYSVQVTDILDSKGNSLFDIDDDGKCDITSDFLTRALFDYQLTDRDGDKHITDTGTEEQDANTGEWSGTQYDTTNKKFLQLQFSTATGKFQYIGRTDSKEAILNLKYLNANINGGLFDKLTDADVKLSTGSTITDSTNGLKNILKGLNYEVTEGKYRFENIEIDFSGTMNYDNGGTSTISMNKGSVEDGTTGAGKKIGALTGLSVDQSGKIFGTYDNGNTTLLGQIAVAHFTNPSGLEALGNNCFNTTLNSGEFDGIGVEVDADGGSMRTGALEMSNVDLSTEFTNMITTQRGFQANSRIITTSDTMLEELLNLKR